MAEKCSKPVKKATAGDGSTRRAMQTRVIIDKIDKCLANQTPIRPGVEFRNLQVRAVVPQAKPLGEKYAFNFVIGAEQAEPILEDTSVLDHAISSACEKMLNFLKNNKVTAAATRRKISVDGAEVMVEEDKKSPEKKLMIVSFQSSIPANAESEFISKLQELLNLGDK